MMRFVLATSLLLGLAACGGRPAEAPPPEPAAMTPPPPMAAAPPPMAGGFEGHYVGSAAPGAGRSCSREENYDFTVAAGHVTGTVTGAAGHSAQLTGTVGPNGHAVLQAGRARVTGTFANGQFNGRTGRSCSREVVASAGH